MEFYYFLHYISLSVDVCLSGMKSSGEVWTWQCGRCAAEFKTKAELDSHMTFCGKTPSLWKYDIAVFFAYGSLQGLNLPYPCLHFSTDSVKPARLVKMIAHRWHLGQFDLTILTSTSLFYPTYLPCPKTYKRTFVKIHKENIVFQKSH